MTLNELQRIKQWHVVHKADHPMSFYAATKKAAEAMAQTRR